MSYGTFPGAFSPTGNEVVLYNAAQGQELVAAEGQVGATAGMELAVGGAASAGVIIAAEGMEIIDNARVGATHGGELVTQAVNRVQTFRGFGNQKNAHELNTTPKRVKGESLSNSAKKKMTSQTPSKGPEPAAPPQYRGGRYKGSSWASRMANRKRKRRRYRY